MKGTWRSSLSDLFRKSDGLPVQIWETKLSFVISCWIPVGWDPLLESAIFIFDLTLQKKCCEITLSDAPMVDKTWRSARWWKVLYRAPSSAPFVGWNKTNNCLHKSRCDSCSDGVAVSAEKQKNSKNRTQKIERQSNCGFGESWNPYLKNYKSQH